MFGEVYIQEPGSLGLAKYKWFKSLKHEQQNFCANEGYAGDYSATIYQCDGCSEYTVPQTAIQFWVDKHFPHRKGANICPLCNESLSAENGLSVSCSAKFGVTHTVCIYAQNQKEKLEALKNGIESRKFCLACHRPLALGETHDGMFCQSLASKSQDFFVKEDMICPVTQKHCDDECCTVGSFCNIKAGENADIKDANDGTEILQKTALKLHFLLLGDALIVDIETQNNTLLGIGGKRKQFTSSNGFFIDCEGKPFDNRAAVFRTYLQLRPQFAYRTFISHSGVEFARIKQALTEFAENNAFHGNEKDAPRIERVTSGKDATFKIIDWEGRSCGIINARATSALQYLAGDKIPVWIDEPRPMFTQEWRKISPPDFPDSRELNAISTRFDGISTLSEVAYEVKNIYAQYYTDLHKNLPEIWEFTMTVNPAD
jgi:hypothetical protein